MQPICKLHTFAPSAANPSFSVLCSPECPNAPASQPASRREGRFSSQAQRDPEHGGCPGKVHVFLFKVPGPLFHLLWTSSPQARRRSPRASLFLRPRFFPFQPYWELPRSTVDFCLATCGCGCASISAVAVIDLSTGEKLCFQSGSGFNSVLVLVRHSSCSCIASIASATTPSIL